jgi:hypothetical protein
MEQSMENDSDETTDKMFPHPESSGVVEVPFPLAPTLRDEFLAHRRHIDAELKAWRTELGLALARLSPELTPGGALAKVKGGVLAGLRYTGVAVAAGEVIAEVAKATGRPEIEGPIRVLITLFRGG